MVPLRTYSLTQNGRGATTAEKLKGTKVWVPTPWRLRPAPGHRPGWLLGAGGGRAPSRCEGPGYHPRKICENSDAKSCILVTTCCEISCFLKLRPRSWGTILPRSQRLLRLCKTAPEVRQQVEKNYTVACYKDVGVTFVLPLCIVQKRDQIILPG